MKVNVQVDKSNKYGHHDSLNFAEIACENDSHCIGIYDASGEHKGPFELVARGFMTSRSQTYSSIHAKKRYDGE